LAARPPQASRLRQRLQTLRAHFDRHLQHLLPLRQLVKGSVYELKTRCGKPACHCASPDGPLHRSTVLSWSHHGRTRLRTLAPGDRARFGRLAENYRRFRQARAALTKLHRQILAAVDRLEKALLVAPPRPPAKKRRPR
jgi:hypothetical protein